MLGEVEIRSYSFKVALNMGGLRSHPQNLGQEPASWNSAQGEG